MLLSQSASEALLVQNSSTGGRATLILDAVPYARVHAYIRAFQASVPPGAPVLLGFSTRGPAVSFMSASYVLAAVPFLQRKYVGASTKMSTPNPPAKPYSSAARTIAPLMVSLQYVLKTLASGPHAMTIESVQNVSDQYAGYLQQHLRDLTDDAGIRARFAGRWGMDGWREERFMVAWEEALCRAGLLTRWVIFARK